jgi:hypothetical protein
MSSTGGMGGIGDGMVGNLYVNREKNEEESRQMQLIDQAS